MAGHSFAWVARFRRLVRDYERTPERFAGLHFVAFAMLMLAKFIHGVKVHNTLNKPATRSRHYG